MRAEDEIRDIAASTVRICLSMAELGICLLRLIDEKMAEDLEREIKEIKEDLEKEETLHRGVSRTAELMKKVEKALSAEP